MDNLPIFFFVSILIGEEKVQQNELTESNLLLFMNNVLEFTHILFLFDANFHWIVNFDIGVVPILGFQYLLMLFISNSFPSDAISYETSRGEFYFFIQNVFNHMCS